MAVYSESCRLITIPERIFNLGLGKLYGAYSSANAKDPHPFYNRYTYTLLVGTGLVLLGIILNVIGLINFYKTPLVIGLLIWMTLGVPFLSKIYTYWRDKNQYIKHIYIFSDGFVWELYKHDKLIDQKVFRYQGQSCDINLKAVSVYMLGIYLHTDYGLIVDYYDYDKDKWRKFKLYQSERNLYEDDNKTKWLVLSMKLIYNSWLNYRD